MILKRIKKGDNRPKRETKAKRPKKIVFMTEEQVNYIKEKLNTAAERIHEDENKEGKEYEIEELDSSRQTNYQEGQQLSNEEVMGLFNEISADAKNSEYKVGITCDPNRREKEHGKTFLAVVDCPSVKKANELEALAEQYGFDAGEHVANAFKPKSMKVYIFKK